MRSKSFSAYDQKLITILTTNSTLSQNDDLTTAQIRVELHKHLIKSYHYSPPAEDGTTPGTLTIGIQLPDAMVHNKAPEVQCSYLVNKIRALIGEIIPDEAVGAADADGLITIALNTAEHPEAIKALNQSRFIMDSADFRLERTNEAGNAR